MSLAASSKLDSRSYAPGDKVPSPGIYRVVHYQHRLPHLATVAATLEFFPSCRVCKERVRFEPRLEVSGYIAPQNKNELAPDVPGDFDFPQRTGTK